MRIRLRSWLIYLAASLAAAGCAMPIEHNLPPAERLFAPGPGVGGPGPGVMAPVMAMSPGPAGFTAAPTVQILFNRPEGMQVRWDVTGQNLFDSTPLVMPGRQNFPQGGIYRLKLTNIAGREGVELYPTLEIGPTTPRTEAYLAHNAIPIQFTEEDFDQVLSGNFVKKVIYLPDPEFQELALANVETLVSTRLDPGMDPIIEADRRGAILAVVRLGNKDVELPGGGGDGAAMLPMGAEGGMLMGPDGGMLPGAYPGCAMGPNGMPSGMSYGMPNGGPAAMGASGLMASHVAGVTAPEWGMPISGTPIGLPGPPHVPLGIPAGLQSHVMRNHTHSNIPEPTKHLRMDVRQQPGYSYPVPPNRVHITEQSITPTLPYGQPHSDRYQLVP